MTESQRKTLMDIAFLTDSLGRNPTLQEVADLQGVTRATVHGKLALLRESGLVHPRRARLTRSGRAAARESLTPLESLMRAWSMASIADKALFLRKIDARP